MWPVWLVGWALGKCPTPMRWAIQFETTDWFTTDADGNATLDVTLERRTALRLLPQS